MRVPPPGFEPENGTLRKYMLSNYFTGAKKAERQPIPFQRNPNRSAAPFPITDIPVIESTFAGDNIMRKLDFVNEKRHRAQGIRGK